MDRTLSHHNNDLINSPLKNFEAPNSHRSSPILESIRIDQSESTDLLQQMQVIQKTADEKMPQLLFK